MYLKYVGMLLIASVYALSSNNSKSGDIWTIDKNEVFVGGCITLVLNLNEREAAQVRIGMDNLEPIQLNRSANLIRNSRGQTLALLSHRFTFPNAMDAYIPVVGQVDMYRMAPIFNEPGEFTISIYYGERELGSQIITVLPLPNSSEEAFDSLYPIVQRQPRVNNPKDALLIKTLLIGGNSGILSVTDDQIKHLRKQITIISQHPDWTEIAIMRLSHLEVRKHYRETIESYAIAVNAGRAMDPERPVTPSIAITLERDMQNPFAKAIQDGISQVIASRRWIPSLVKHPENRDKP